MATIKREVKFKCANDCKESGCPGHTYYGLLQNTSDVIIIKNEKGEKVFSGDMNGTRALLQILKELDYNNVYFYKYFKDDYVKKI